MSFFYSAVTGTHCVFPHRDGQAEWQVTYEIVYLPHMIVTLLTGPDVEETTLIETSMLPLEKLDSALVILSIRFYTV